MTSNHPQTTNCESPDHVSVEVAHASATRRCDAVSLSASEVEEAEPRIWKVLAMRDALRKGSYRVSTAELADALFAYAALPSR